MVRNKTKKNRNRKRKGAKRKVSQKAKKAVAQEDYKSRYFGGESEYVGVDKRPIIILIIIGVLIGGVYFYLTKGRKSEFTQVRSNTEKSIKDKLGVWEKKYPKGVKVVTIYNNKTIESSIDTFPDVLSIDWPKIFLSRATPEELRDNPALTKINIWGINYPLVRISNIDLVVSLEKRQGIVKKVYELGPLTLYIEVIDVYENSLVCLFGIR